jgi:putative antitoxin of VapBC-like toxin-antitoxin system
MVSRMKTTVEIPDALLASARKVASRERTTVRALVEEGLRKVLESRDGVPAFHLRKATFRGNGVQPNVGEGSWERIRDLAYEGRGA